MDAEKAGVVIPEKDPVIEPEKANDGDKKGIDTQEKGGDGNAKPTPAKDPSDPTERINNLMSNWQKEQSEHGKTKVQLDVLQKQIIELIGRKAEKTEIEDLPAFMKPDWKPETFEELQQAIIEATEYGSKKTLSQIESERANQADAEKQVDDFVAKVKTEDSEFDEDDFYGYIKRTKIPVRTVEDLDGAYTAHKELRESVKNAEKNAVENFKKRSLDTVHKPGPSGDKGGGPSYKEISSADSVLEIALDSFRKKSN